MAFKNAALTLVLLACAVSTSARSHFITDRTCTSDSDCRSPLARHNGNDTICASGLCQCSDPTRVLSTVALNGRSSEFDGYYYVESTSVCAPKVDQSCQTFCQPHAFCRHPIRSRSASARIFGDDGLEEVLSSNGTCTCLPNRFLNSTSGRCECNPGFEEHPKSGDCLWKLPDSCKLDSDCTPSDSEEQGLGCFNSTCQCRDFNSTWETIRISHAWTKTDFNGTFYSYGAHGFYRGCLPKPGQPCLGRKGLCSPGSLCDWSQYGRQYCKCGLEALLSNSTGLCECPKHFKFRFHQQRNSGDCFIDWETPCTSDEDCNLPNVTASGSTISTSTLLAYSKCVNGTCGCNPENSIREPITRWSITNNSNVFVTRQLTNYGVGFQETVPYQDGLENSISNETFCALKPQADCSPGTSICAWGSRCTVTGSPYYGYGTYYTRYSRPGKCSCLLNQKLNATTGYCACDRNYYRDNVTDSCEYRKPEICELDLDCDRDPVSNTTLVCLSGKCVCNPETSVWAKVQTSDVNVDPVHPEFRGFSNASLFAVTAELCAPKPSRPCARHGLCSPASYCVYVSPVSWTGVCRCIPHSAVSNSTGLCECLPGYKLNDAGICEGALFNQTCSPERPCGVDLDSLRPLSCIAGRCQCDPETSVFASVFTSNTGVHTDNPSFQGYSKINSTSVALCAPKPGQKCAGRGFCAPNSYCVYRTISAWTGFCRCLPNMVVNASSGLCECPAAFELTPDGQCHSVVPESCQTDSHCGTDPVSSLPLVCLNSKCECDPARSVAILANATLIRSLLGSHVYVGQKAGNTTAQEVRACALRQGKICGGTTGIRFCAPGTVCRSRYSMYSVTESTCACDSDKIINSAKGICECPSGSIVDSTGACSPGVGRRCSYGYTYGCGVDPKSQQRLECRNNVCSCNPATHEAKTEVVPVPKHPLVMRLASDDFRNITYCAAKPGTRCLKNNCIPGAFCADESLKATNESGVCVCSPGTVFSNTGMLSRCISAFEAPCDKYKACTSGLYCIEGQCRCQLKSQQFDTSRMTCVSKVGGPCHDTNACVSYSICQDERCLCDTGFLENPATSACQRPFGTPCDDKELECGPKEQFRCSNGRCECQTLFTYDANQEDCVGLVGAPCNSTGGSGGGGRCVANAACLSDSNKCACEEGFSAVANGLCAAEVSGTSEDHREADEIHVDAATVSTMTIVLYTCIALLVTVGLVGVGIFVYFRKTPSYPISINSSRRAAGSGEDYETLQEPDTNL